MKTLTAKKMARQGSQRAKLLRCLLAICLVATMVPAGALPHAAQAQEAPTSKTANAIELGSTGFARHGLVYFGSYEGEPIAWNLLPNARTGAWEGAGAAYKYPGAAVDPKSDVALLMSEYTVADKPYNEGGRAVYWKDSTLRSWLNGEFLNGAFTSEEQTYLLKTANEYYQFRRLDGDKVFLLDATEVPAYVYGLSQDSKGGYHYADTPQPASDRAGNVRAWWTRQINGQAGHATAAYVVKGTDLNSDTSSNSWIMDEQAPDANAGVRPFVSLDMRKVLFSTPANLAADELGLKANTASAANELKLTMRDASHDGFDVTDAQVTGAPGQTASFSYTGATTGANEYLSAMIVDPCNPDEVLYYGQVKQLSEPSDAAGTVEFVLPADLAAGSTYTMHLFNEQVNGKMKTNFSSEFKDVALEVKKPVTASEFSFVPPTDTTYDGGAKAATLTVKPEVEGMGDVTMKYYQGDREVARPANAGTYTVKIDVAESDIYAAATGVSDPSWTFIITKATSRTDVPSTGAGITYGDDVTLTAEVGRVVPRAEEAEATEAGELEADSVATSEAEYVEFYAGEEGQEVLLGTAPVVYDVSGERGRAELSVRTTDKILKPGVNTVVARYSGNVNLNGSGSSATTVTVLPKTVELSWAGVDTRTYDGVAAHVTAAVTNALPGDEVGVMVDGGNQVSAGDYTAVAVLTGAQAAYYQLPEVATCSYSILPPAHEVTPKHTEVAPAQTHTDGASGGTADNSVADSDASAEQQVQTDAASTVSQGARKSRVASSPHERALRGDGANGAISIQNALTQIGSHGPLLWAALVLAAPSARRGGVNALYARACRVAHAGRRRVLRKRSRRS